MSNTKVQRQEKQMVEELLGDDLVRNIIKEFNLENDTQEEQAEFVAELGENIMVSVIDEILKRLPQSAHAKFRLLFEGGDAGALKSFLDSHIPDVERFIYNESQKEYETTKSTIQMKLQGV